MRFGWRAAVAAAAMMLGAGQAGAVTYIKYEATGTGTKTYYGGGYPFVSTTGELIFDFVIEVDPGFSSPPNRTYGDGSNFSYEAPPGLYTASLTSPGNLTVSYNYSSAPIVQATANISFVGSGSTFPTMLASNAASGSVSYGLSGRLPENQYAISGTISKLIILGQVPSFAEPFASVVPEPATWTTMIGGMGAIGAVLRRRRRTARVVAV